MARRTLDLGHTSVGNGAAFAVAPADELLLTADPDVASHSRHVGVIAGAIATRLGISGDALDRLVLAARLHDIGKMEIPSEILRKEGTLSADEWALIQRHTITGERIICSADTLADVGRLVRHSHERWDGRGYPDGLRGEEIPLASRIIFCADAYQVMRSGRPYNRRRSAEDALAELRRCSGTQFDPRVVEALSELIRPTQQ
jgi:HD-GYP domain-containing protein (c-di-GMP phosphodiesterase class II)